MKNISFAIPDYLIKKFEKHHKNILVFDDSKEFEQTICSLLKYSIGDTRGISEKEIILIEEFFYKKDHYLKEFLLKVISEQNIHGQIQ